MTCINNIGARKELCFFAAIALLRRRTRLRDIPYMPIFAQITLTTLLLETAVTRIPDEEIHFEDYCVLRSGGIGLRFWIASSTVEEFKKGLEEDETVSSSEILIQDHSRYLFQIQLSECGKAKSYIQLLGEFGGEVLDNKRANGHWRIQLRFPDHAALQGFYDYFHADSDISMIVDKIHRERNFDGQSFGLTPEQREAVQTACEQGYFDVPRGVTLESISDELGVSDQAVSERLRRAQKRVFEQIFNE